jgi:predicted glycoside hydrolase/deacetylase ChbG (UPF0249 family)
VLAIATVLSTAVGWVHAETWADRLGYPAGSKVVVLHANELGMCHETNAAWAKLLESGIVKSGSAIVPAPWFGDFAKRSVAHPNADIGIELTLNSEFDDYRWQPVASGLVPSLADGDGFLWRTPNQTASNASVEDVEFELLAQIERAKESGLDPSHLTTHLGTLVTRPDLIEVYLRIARQEWIPAMVVELTPEKIEQLAAQGYALPEDVIELFSDYPLPKVDDIRHVGPAESYDAKKQAFLKMLSELPPGITQISLRPAVASDALSSITDDAQQRAWDAELLADEEVRQALTTDGVVLTDWREIMRRFDGAPEESTTNSK